MIEGADNAAVAEPPLEQVAVAGPELGNATRDAGETSVEAAAETTTIEESRDASTNAEMEDADEVQEVSAVNTAVEDTAEGAVVDEEPHPYAVAPDCEAAPSMRTEEAGHTPNLGPHCICESGARNSRDRR